VILKMTKMPLRRVVVPAYVSSNEWNRVNLSLTAGTRKIFPAPAVRNSLTWP
jgi:hypothetical protein